MRPKDGLMPALRPGLGLVLLLLGSWLVAGEPINVSGGGGLDYQASVIQPWGQPDQRIVVFERLNPSTLSGDLYQTRSEDAGMSWSEPVGIVTTPANERHASLVQTGAASFQLFYLSNASGGFRIHRASSDDGEAFLQLGAIDLGWPAGGEINPHVVRHADGSLTLTYHRLSGAAYIAGSVDDGVSWDTNRVQVSPGNAALPRVAYRESDGRYFLVYQTNPGNNQLQLWSRTSLDPASWTDSPQQIVPDGNNHDALPLVLASGGLIVFWARVAEGNFQIFSAESNNASNWSLPTQRVSRPNLANVQPHGLVLDGHIIDLYWGAASNSSGTDYDILRLSLDLDRRFIDRFELAP